MCPGSAALLAKAHLKVANYAALAHVIGETGKELGSD
jgi:hypothetical protein